MTDQVSNGRMNLPRYSPIPQACQILGFQRSKMYELAGLGAIRIVKVGGRSLVDIEHAIHWMATLPLANIASPSIAVPG